MDEQYKNILRCAARVAGLRGPDTNHPEWNVATTDLDAMIDLQNKMSEAFGAEAEDYAVIIKEINKL